MKEIRKPKVGDRIIIDLITGGVTVGIYKGYGEVFDEPAVAIDSDGGYFVAPVTVPRREIKQIHYVDEKTYERFLIANAAHREEWENAVDSGNLWAKENKAGLVIPKPKIIDPKSKIPGMR